MGLLDLTGKRGLVVGIANVATMLARMASCAVALVAVRYGRVAWP
jgi:hypothetical protein